MLLNKVNEHDDTGDDKLLKQKPEEKKISDYSTHGDINDHLGEMLGEKFQTYRKQWQQAESNLEIFDFPLFLVIETINTCNLSCTMCFRSQVPEPERALMPMDMFKKILDEASKYKCPSLSLNWNNEPLLDPHLPERVEMAKKAGFLDIRVNTNAIPLTPKKSEELINAGLTRLSVSIDAATSETFSQVRTGGDYKRLIDNVNNFIEIRKKMGARLPLLRCTFVRIRENEHELDDFIKLWENKADYVSIQSYVPHSTEDRALELHPKKQSHLADVTCSSPFERLIVTVHGMVHPCCSELGKEIVLGDINHSTLHEIWHSEMAVKLRQMMQERSWNEFSVCRRCLEGTFKS